MDLPDYHKRVSRARRLRRQSTDAELALWKHLRGRRFEGWKFRRQVPMGRYIVDFFCLEAGLVIEVDGGQHDRDRRKDEIRTAYIASHGYRVIRFWNNDVLSNIEGVLEQVLSTLKRGSIKPPLPEGEGGG
ncbi:MAG TPA: endonuclease domain-containing protein [Candidatus Binatia bacterium]|nr:endonuclease domain-containing protein [Candidatus Binatia bacterium]